MIYDMILAPKAKPIIRATHTPSVPWTFINSERKSLNLGTGDIWDSKWAAGGQLKDSNWQKHTKPHRFCQIPCTNISDASISHVYKTVLPQHPSLVLASKKKCKTVSPSSGSSPSLNLFTKRKQARDGCKYTRFTPPKTNTSPKKGAFQYESTLPTTSTTFNYYVSGGHVLVFQGSTGKKTRLGVTWTLLRSHCWMECWTSKLLSNSARMFSTSTFTNWNRFWWKVIWWSYMHRFCHEVPMMVICLTANIASKKHAQCSKQPQNSNQPAWNSDWRNEKSKRRWQSTSTVPNTTYYIDRTFEHLPCLFFHTNDIACDSHHYSASRFDTPPVFNQVLAVGFWGCKSCPLLAKDILQIFYRVGGG